MSEPAFTITHSSFVIAVPDLMRSAAFYRDVLGFTVEEIGDPGWRLYRRGPCVIMAGECRDALPPADLGDHSYFAYLTVLGIDSYHAFIKSNAGQQKVLLGAPTDKPWKMREFPIRTVDGHRIMIGQPIA